MASALGLTRLRYGSNLGEFGMLSGSNVTMRPLSAEGRMPLVIETLDSIGNVPGLLRDNRAEIESLLLRHGALVFRGFDIASIARFGSVVESLKNQALAYEYRSTPREQLGRDIYTASEYPAKHVIPMHCENAYQRDWPTKILFACTQPSETGGQTPLADMIEVTKRLSPACMKAFADKGVCYIRNYHEGIDLSWQTVFQTDSRDEVAAMCRRMGIEYEWLDDDLLRTRQKAQGVARHHTVDTTLFFNQAHLFHVSSLGEEAAESMVDTFGLDELPRHACFGDMTEIPDDMLTEIRAAYTAEKVFFDWRKGDFVLIDNMQVAHGREAFTGQRQILASLCDPYTQRRNASGAGSTGVLDTLARVD